MQVEQTNTALVADSEEQRKVIELLREEVAACQAPAFTFTSLLLLILLLHLLLLYLVLAAAPPGRQKGERPSIFRAETETCRRLLGL